jgi:hypothetical protein
MPGPIFIMNKKRAICIIIAILIILLISGYLVLNNEYILSNISGFYAGRWLNADVHIGKAVVSFQKKTITATDVFISSKKGLRCKIDTARICYNDIFSLVTDRAFSFRLDGIELSYPDSKVISGIAAVLSLKPIELLQFYYAKGLYSKRENEEILESVEAEGKLLKIYTYGSTVGEKNINYSFKIFLSGELIASVPESIRKVLFKQDGDQSAVELSVSGDIEKPSISFSTDLLKFTYR